MTAWLRETTFQKQSLKECGMQNTSPNRLISDKSRAPLRISRPVAAGGVALSAPRSQALRCPPEAGFFWVWEFGAV